MSRTTPPEHTSRPGPSRRRLVRGAALAVWAVPAIQVASAVPAFAVSGPCQVTPSGTAAWRDSNEDFIDFVLTLDNGCDTAVSLFVSIIVCGIDGLTYGPDADLPAGWSQQGAAGDSGTTTGPGCVEFNYTATNSLAAHASTSPSFVLETTAYSGGARPPGSATVEASGGTNTGVAVLGIAPIS